MCVYMFSRTIMQNLQNLPPHIILFIARHARVRMGFRSPIRNSHVALSPAHRDEINLLIFTAHIWSNRIKFSRFLVYNI